MAAQQGKRHGEQHAQAWKIVKSPCGRPTKGVAPQNRGIDKNKNCLVGEITQTGQSEISSQAFGPVLVGVKIPMGC